MKYEPGVPEVRDTPGAGDPQGPRRRSFPIPAARPLTPRQLMALQYIALGHTERDASRRMGIALSTLSQHLAAARDRLDARSTAHAVALAIAAGLIHVEG
jgi:DNA-binding CsgD family transcriptional regulator